MGLGLGLGHRLRGLAREVHAVGRHLEGLRVDCDGGHRVVVHLVRVRVSVRVRVGVRVGLGLGLGFGFGFGFGVGFGLPSPLTLTLTPP